LLSAGEDGIIRVWQLAGGERKLRSFGKEVTSIAFRSDGKILASGGKDGAIKLWDYAKGKELRAFKGHTGSVVRVVYHPDGKMLASAGADQTVKLWDVTGAEQ
jgi:WD40 repeat protein